MSDEKLLKVRAYIDTLLATEEPEEPPGPPPPPPPTGNETVLLDRWVPTAAEPQKTVGPVPIAGGATITVDVEVGAPHPTEPNGQHVLAWITPNVKQQKNEAVYVLLRNGELKIKQRKEQYGVAIGGVGPGSSVRIVTAFGATGGVYVDVYVGGVKQQSVALKTVSSAAPMFVWLSALNPGQTIGPEVPSIGWAHSCKVSR